MNCRLPFLACAIVFTAWHNELKAQQTSGSLTAWGSPSMWIPVMERGTKFIAVSPTEQYTAALTDDGRVVAWGSFYQYSAVYYPPPPHLHNVKALASDGTATIALLTDGTVRELRTGSPSGPPDLTNAVAIALGRAGRLALKADGNSMGNLGRKYPGDPRPK